MPIVCVCPTNQFTKRIHPFFIRVISTDCTKCHLMFRFLSLENVYLNLRFTSKTEDQKKEKKSNTQTIYINWVCFAVMLFSSPSSSSWDLHFCTDLLAVGNCSRSFACALFMMAEPMWQPKSRRSLFESLRAHTRNTRVRVHCFAPQAMVAFFNKRDYNMRIRYHLALHTHMHMHMHINYIQVTYTLSFDDKNWHIPKQLQQ